MTSLKFTAVTVACAMLAACATPQTGPTVEERGPEPTRDQAEHAALAFLQAHLKDPGSLQQFALTYGPVPAQWYRGILNGGGNAQGWLVCFQYNAKNSYGGYVGIQNDGVILRMSGSDAYVVPSVNWIITDVRCPGM